MKRLRDFAFKSIACSVFRGTGNCVGRLCLPIVGQVIAENLDNIVILFCHYSKIHFEYDSLTIFAGNTQNTYVRVYPSSVK